MTQTTDLITTTAKPAASALALTHRQQETLATLASRPESIRLSSTVIPVVVWLRDTTFAPAVCLGLTPAGRILVQFADSNIREISPTRIYDRTTLILGSTSGTGHAWRARLARLCVAQAAAASDTLDV